MSKLTQDELQEMVKLWAMLNIILEKTTELKGRNRKVFKHSLKRRMSLLEQELNTYLKEPLSKLYENEEELFQQIQLWQEYLLDIDIAELMQKAVTKYNEKQQELKG